MGKEKFFQCVGTLAVCLNLLALCCLTDAEGAFLPTEKRYIQAKAGIDNLKMDEKQAGLRQPWEKLAEEFRSIYDTDPDWPNRPAALFRGAESLEELAKRSFLRKDAQKAVAAYELVAERHPDSRLADDALYRAAKMRAAWLKDEKGALELLARIKSNYPKGDMFPEAIALEKTLLASAKGQTSPEAKFVARSEQLEIKEEPSVNAVAVVNAKDLTARYNLAKKKLVALTEQPLAKAHVRNAWENLQKEFLAIYQADQSLPVAPAAFFRAAMCRQRLAEQSQMKGDYLTAAELFLAVTEAYPKSVLADDALLSGAEIYRKELEDNERALTILNRLLKNYPNGDMAPQARKIYAGLKKLKPGLANNKGAASELQILSWNTPNKNNVEIVLEMSAPTRYDAKFVRNEKTKIAKLYLDLGKTRLSEDIRRGVNINGSLLQRIRSEPAPVGQTRLCFEFNNATRFNSYTKVRPDRIVLTVSSGTVPGPELTPLPKVRQASDLARQLGLGVRTVFIDAGHGGHDPGASHNNIVERAITLDVARMLGRMLAANGLDVVYSRTRDKYVPLSERAERANAARADLFVSIHVNAHKDSTVKGLETYYLDLARSAEEAELAALENVGSDRRLGDLQNVLASIMLNARVDESRRLAQDIQNVTVARLRKRGQEIKSNGVKSAPFHVLIGAQMPAILVEIGYCTNPEEARLLRDDKYRHYLAEGLTESILTYRDRLLQRNTAENIHR